MGAVDDVEAVAKIMGLTREQQKMVVRSLWVGGVTFSISYMLGFLTAIGLTSPFARADDFAQLKQNSTLSATISVGREIRDQYTILCSVTKPEERRAFYNYIEYLQQEYFRLTRQRYPDPGCPR